MLYLDSSALIKRYIAEKGSDQVAVCFSSGEMVYTSSLSYAEVLAAFARRLRERLLSPIEADGAQDGFLLDWNKHLHEIPLDRRVLAGMPALFRAHPLRGADGVHLASALWLRGIAKAAGESFSFGVADERLARVAAACALPVFNPETP